MKKLTGVVSSVVLTLGLWATPALAEEVTVTLPTFPVTLNGVVMDQNQSQYPCLVYKDITYVAMTYHDARLLGLQSGWNDSTGLAINKAALIADQETLKGNYQPYKAAEANGTSYQAILPTFAIQVNGTAIDNQTEEYPLLNFRDVTYFPLTWRFAVTEFGWKYTFDTENGLVITPTPTPTAVVDTNITGDGSIIAPSTEKSIIGQTVKTNTSAVNLRTGPGTTYEKVTLLPNTGTELTVLAEKDNWYQINTVDGVTAWVASWLVEKDEPSQGVLTQVAIQSLQPAADKTVLVLDHGQYNKVRVDSATATTLNLTLSNTTVASSLSNMNFPTGPLQALKATGSDNNTVKVNMDLKAGSYCVIQENEGALTVTVHARQGENESGLMGKTIVLDPGHGGNDVGAVGTILGVTDAAVGLGVAEKLKVMLEAQGANVVMTRTDNNTAVELYSRPALSNSLEADLFISIHADSTKPNAIPYGSKVFYYAGHEYMTLTAQKYIREELANAVQEGIAAATLRKSTVASNSYAVIRENNSPCLLVECGFLSNAEDEALLATEEYRQKLADGIFAGVSKYFNLYQ